MSEARRTLARLWRTLIRGVRAAFLALVGAVVVALLRVLRHGDRRRVADRVAALTRWLGPWLPEQRVARANLVKAFPEKSEAEIEAILTGTWDNLGRIAVEFLHLDQITIGEAGQASDSDVIYDPISAERLQRIREQPRARLVFGTHLGNWELPARFAHALGFDSTVLYRPPNIRAIANAVIEMRASCMGTLVPSGIDAPIRLARALERGGSAGMLVDQHDSRGVDVVFFGRPCKASPLLARLARHLECPIHGVRMIRCEDRNRFWGELTDPITPVRDNDGKIDVAGTTQVIATLVESWVREHPDQWLWQHRRWR